MLIRAAQNKSIRRKQIRQREAIPSDSTHGQDAYGNDVTSACYYLGRDEASFIMGVELYVSQLLLGRLRAATLSISLRCRCKGRLANASS